MPAFVYVGPFTACAPECARHTHPPTHLIAIQPHVQLQRRDGLPVEAQALPHVEVEHRDMNIHVSNLQYHEVEQGPQGVLVTHTD
jgi:hypothetical protein